MIGTLAARSGDIGTPAGQQPVGAGTRGTLPLMKRCWLAAPFSIALLVAGCSDDPEEGSGGSAKDEAGQFPAFMDRFADILGCDSWAEAVSDGRLGSAVGHSCVVEQSQVAWVHTFPVSERGLHFRHFERRSPIENVVCDDGESPPGSGPWILVGDEWAVSSYHADLVARVEDALGGEYAGGGGVGEAPPSGPPVSFQVPDVCADR